MSMKQRALGETKAQLKLALSRYHFDDMNTEELAAFASNPPADLEANERRAMIEEMSDRMLFWFNACNM